MTERLPRAVPFPEFQLVRGALQSGRLPGDNAVRNGGFCRSPEFFVIAIEFVLTIALVCSGGPNARAAEPPPPAIPKSKFLQLSEAERWWFLEGAMRTAAHLTALQDGKRGDCVGNWYLKDRDAKRKLIEKTLAENPKISETTVVLSLLTQACGPLVPAMEH